MIEHCRYFFSLSVIVVSLISLGLMLSGSTVATQVEVLPLGTSFQRTHLYNLIDVPPGLAEDDWAQIVRQVVSLNQQAYLKASNTGTHDNFAWSVAISGNTVIVGAPYEDSSATGVNGDQTNNSAGSAGAAYVFVRNGSTWSQQAYLKASNAGGADAFGYAVAISRDTIVVGALFEDSSATGVDGNQANNSAPNAGAAYVFVRNGTTWSQQAYLKASNTNEDDDFGGAVAIDGDTIIVGASHEGSSTTGVNSQPNNSAPRAGAAYVFVRNGSTWSQQAYLKASNTGAYHFFGSTVGLDDDTAIVGASFEGGASGAAYVFVRNGSTWSQQAYLKASNAQTQDYFGKAVAISGDTAVVGANFEASGATGVNGDQTDNSIAYAGAAYVFVRNGSTWSQQAYLKASNTDLQDHFGEAVAISGDTIMVGARQEDSNATGVDGDQADNSTTYSGAVYVFVRNSGSWSQLAYLKASNTGFGDRFGWSVAVSGDTAIVGAAIEDSSATGVNGNQNNDSAEAAGAAYIFTGFPAPEMAVLGNGEIITDGDPAPSTTDDTDFGNATVAGGQVDHTFTITNSGTSPLNLIGTPRVSIIGMAASDFSVIQQPTSPVLNDGTTSTFIVRFDPSAVGQRIAEVSIANNDIDENPYDFTIQGTGTLPEIMVLDGVSDIVDGVGFVNFGSTMVDIPITKTFTISNVGGADLFLSGLTAPSGFTVTSDFASTTVAAGSSTTFWITMNAFATGMVSGTVQFDNNDSDETPFDFTVGGMVYNKTIFLPLILKDN